jgi:hypothetical protein
LTCVVVIDCVTPAQQTLVTLQVGYDAAAAAADDWPDVAAQRDCQTALMLAEGDVAAAKQQFISRMAPRTAGATARHSRREAAGAGTGG